MTEDLERILVGGLEARKVEIVDYDDAWPRRFERERERISVGLQGVAVRIEHIGSTAVPGLAAKPVVDILVTVTDVERDEPRFALAIEELGFDLRVREEGHRAYRTPQRDVNLHVWSDDEPEVENYLVFRDHLRGHPEDRELYARVKRELAKREWADVNHYADAKTEVVQDIMSRARSL